MIDQAIRTELRSKIRKGDYEAAAQIYKKIAKRNITPRYLQKFITGHKNPLARPGCHDPGQMFEAIAEAVDQRQRRERQYSDDARRRLEEIIRQDTAPQPIAL